MMEMVASGQNGMIRQAGEGWGVQSGLEAGRINSDGAEGGSGEWEKGPKGLKQPPWESGRLASRLARYSPRAAHDAPL